MDALGIKAVVKHSDSKIASLQERVVVLETNGGGLASVVDAKRPGFFIVDENNKIALQYTEDGLDAAKISSHFKSIITEAVVGITASIYSYTNYAEV